MIHDAIEWASLALGSPVVEHEPLSGGMTSTMLALTDAGGGRSVLRLMTEEPWRTHGEALTRREQAALREVARTQIPAPATIALDADGTVTWVSAHLMSRMPGTPTQEVGDDSLRAMSEMLARIHDVRPGTTFRTFESWAWEAKWVVPAWSGNPHSWQRAFDVLAQHPPAYTPTFLHRDFSHRNLMWQGDSISAVVDWVETSTGPAWLDVGHAATNLAVTFGPDRGRRFVQSYSAATGLRPEAYWLVMDAVGFLPPPGKKLMFRSADERARLDAWLHYVITH